MKQISYKKGFVAFIDIMGFSDLVESSDDQESKVNISTIIEALEIPGPVELEKIVIGRIGDIAESEYKFSNFSDLVAISCEPTERGLIRLIHHIGKIGFKLLRMGLLIRGGVVKGKIYHEGNMIFGPALVKAYKLEHDIAKYPRVILSDEVVNFGQKMYEPACKVFKRFTRVCDDGYTMIHILRTLQLISDAGYTKDPRLFEFIAEIEEKLLSEIKNKESNRHVHSKLIWFYDYFKKTTR